MMILDNNFPILTIKIMKQNALMEINFDSMNEQGNKVQIQ